MKRLLLIVALLLLPFTSRPANLPEKLRVLSIDLATLNLQSTNPPNANISQELKRLLDKADPDIIFLQRAVDWEYCERICKLRPNLRVVTCSAFPAQAAAPITPQVAILAKDKAVLSWVEDVPGNQGFAFALLQAGSRKLGIYSVQATPGSAAATQQVLAEVKKIQQFNTNRADSILITGVSLPKSALAQAGFENIAAETKPSAKPIPAEFWASNAGFLSRPRSLAIAGIPQPLLVADIDSGSSYSSKFAAQTPLLFPGETPPPIRAVIQQPLWQRIWPAILATVGVIVALFAALLFLVRRQRKSMALVPITGPNGEFTPGPVLDDAARTDLLSWLKTVFVQRLLFQRQQMIAAESEATRRTLAIEDKITQLQGALQDRITAYETRIQRLETELTAATFENRDLIRSQIDLLKEKVAQAKEEFAFRRN